MKKNLKRIVSILCIASMLGTLCISVSVSAEDTVVNYLFDDFETPHLTNTANPLGGNLPVHNVEGEVSSITWKKMSNSVAATASTTATEDSLDVVVDPDDSSNHCLKYSTTSNSTGADRIAAFYSGFGDQKYTRTVSFDLKINDTSTTKTKSTYFCFGGVGTKGIILYWWTTSSGAPTLSLYNGSKELFNEHRVTTEGNKWYNVKLYFHDITSRKDGSVDYYVDNTYVGTAAYTDDMGYNDNGFFGITTAKGAARDVYIDNLSLEYENAPESKVSPYGDTKVRVANLHYEVEKTTTDEGANAFIMHVKANIADASETPAIKNLILARYNSEGELRGVNLSAREDSGDFSTNSGIITSEARQYFKCFVWGSDSVRPYADVLERNIKLSEVQ